jgi:hypothetical protein
VIPSKRAATPAFVGPDRPTPMSSMTPPESLQSDPPDKPPEPAPPAANLRQVAGAVFWSFFGVRKGAHMKEDTTTIKLHHVVIVGLLSGLAFVLVLVALVMFITRNT